MGGCGCAKKKTGNIQFMGRDGNQVADPVEWGPVLWKYLHCITEKIGYTGNPIVDTDQANYMEYIIIHLADILPCTECQSHAKEYITHNPIPSLQGKYGDNLRATIRTWLFQFHNTVRNRKNQQITIHNPDECITVYNECFVPQCEFTLLTQSVAFGIRQGWIKLEVWKKWYNFSERLRILTGNNIIR